ncbi:MAG: hypothetical protein ABW128_10410 [Rhizorhabdus sp.]
MEILATRKRITGTLPHYEYRLFVPFDQLSDERQRLIHYRTDFGTRQGLHARLADVIAPIEHLRMPPGLRRHDLGRGIATIAKRVETLLIAAIYPEMTAVLVPILFLASEEHNDAQVFTCTMDLVCRFAWLAERIDHLTAAGLALHGIVAEQAA